MTVWKTGGIISFTAVCESKPPPTDHLLEVLFPLIAFFMWESYVVFVHMNNCLLFSTTCLTTGRFHYKVTNKVQRFAFASLLDSQLVKWWIHADGAKWNAIPHCNVVQRVNPPQTGGRVSHLENFQGQNQTFLALLPRQCWQQCQRKIKHRKVLYKKINDSGQGKEIFPFIEELDIVLRDRPSFMVLMLSKTNFTTYTMPRL